MKRSLVAFSIFLLILEIGLAQNEAGRIVALRGQVEVQAPLWRAASLNQTLFEGSLIRTLARSRVVILLVDETQLKLNENTQIELRAANHSSRNPVKSFLTTSSKSSLEPGGWKSFSRLRI